MNDPKSIEKLKAKINHYEEMIIKLKDLLGSSDGNISENDQKKIDLIESYMDKIKKKLKIYSNETENAVPDRVSEHPKNKKRKTGVFIKGKKKQKEELLEFLNKNSQLEYVIDRTFLVTQLPKGKTVEELDTFDQAMWNATNNTKQAIGYYLVENDVEIDGDSYDSGEIDLHDLLNMPSPILSKGLIIHFTVERLESPNYEKIIRDNSKDGELHRKILFANVHNKAVKEEMIFYKEQFPNVNIQMPKKDLILDYDSKSFFEDYMLIDLKRTFGDLEIIYTKKLKKTGKNTYESPKNGNGELIRIDYKIIKK
ncbi:MAG: hypothetical protein MK212_02020 [Saprospiraceae bacterium]|nr:hypothetical protein [Saprospiraceae bacterium]